MDMASEEAVPGKRLGVASQSGFRLVRDSSLSKPQSPERVRQKRVVDCERALSHAIRVLDRPSLL